MSKLLEAAEALLADFDCVRREHHSDHLQVSPFIAALRAALEEEKTLQAEMGKWEEASDNLGTQPDGAFIAQSGGTTHADGKFEPAPWTSGPSISGPPEAFGLPPTPPGTLPGGTYEVTEIDHEAKSYTVEPARGTPEPYAWCGISHDGEILGFSRPSYERKPWDGGEWVPLYRHPAQSAEVTRPRKTHHDGDCDIHDVEVQLCTCGYNHERKSESVDLEDFAAVKEMDTEVGLEAESRRVLSKHYHPEAHDDIPPAADGEELRKALLLFVEEETIQPGDGTLPGFQAGLQTGWGHARNRIKELLNAHRAGKAKGEAT